MGSGESRSSLVEDADGLALRDRFRVLGELGRGGMSVVLLVEDRLRGKQLALKRMQHSAATDVRRLKREYRAIERIVHPNIVAVYELGIDAEGPYFLMEAVGGTNLRRWCRTSLADELAADSATAAHGVSTITTRDVTASGWGPAQHTIEHAHTTATLTLDSDDGDTAPPSGRGGALAALDDKGITRLLRVLPQLIAALECLHDAGLVHCDLKPANVLVSGDGTLKLLDFGILGETDGAPNAGLLGTAAYMAPEQIRGEPPTPGVDLYALGVMLFEVLTGHLPFAAANRKDLLRQHLDAQPLAAHVLAPRCPPWLSQAIAALLDKAPSRRPSLRALRELCAAHVPGIAAPSPAPAAAALVERHEQQQILLDVLDDASRPRLRFVSIHGETGIGKSALLEWTRGAARRRQMTVLESRVSFSERVPFNAVDGVVDNLAALLERFPELCGDDDGERLLDTASTAFPVLAHGLGRRGSATLEPRAGARPGSDPQPVFDALIALLQRCTRITGRLVLLCDDLQWADADSVSFLLRLIAAQPPGVLLVASVRDDTHTEAFARLWSRCSPDVRIDLSRLSERGLAYIITGVAAGAGHAIAERAAYQAALGCDGRPLLAVICGRVAARSELGAAQPLAWLLDRYAKRGSSERRLLALLAVIDGDTALAQLARLSEMAPGQVDELLSPLERERLMRLTGSFGAQRAYDFSHDLVRRHVLALLSAPELREAHADVADDLAESGAPAAQRVRHLLGAERSQEAAEVAAIGAREAEAKHAFGLAAELYELAIAHTSASTDALRVARAAALERCGHYLEAAREWQCLADQGSGKLQVDALLHQAKALLATERFVEGRRTLERAQRALQQRTLVPKALARGIALVRFFLGPWAAPGRARMRGDTPSTPADERDTYLSAVIGFFDPIAGMHSLLQARRKCRRSGNRTQAAEIDYGLAYLALFGERRSVRTGLGDRYARSARRALGEQVTPEHGLPYVLDLMFQGVRALRFGDFRAAAAAFDGAVAGCLSIGRRGTFDHLFCMVYRAGVDRHAQNVDSFSAQLDALERVIDDCQDSSLRSELGFGRTRCAFLRGDMAEALRFGKMTCERWPQDEPSYQAYQSQLQLLTPQIYLSDGVAARDELERVLKTHARFMPMHCIEGIDLLSVRAFFEAAALLRGVPGASARKVLRWAKLAESCCPLDRNLALRAAAYAYDATGKPQHALRQLERAERIAESYGQLLDVAIARYQRGLRLGGDEGKALMGSAEQAVVRAGSRTLLLHEDPSWR
jgi:serine/threonine protein kinase/tetratricopeptide (TPR) repeat protein